MANLETIGPDVLSQPLNNNFAALNADLGGWRIYNDVTELGLTPGSETMEQIATKMADKSMLIFQKLSTNTSTAYPFTTGILVVTKISIFRIAFEFFSRTSERPVKWIGYYDSNQSPNFTGWSQDALEYETGTFTPELNFGGASTGITYSSRFGRYTRIGNVVFWDIDMVLTSKGSATGDATIAGLPFTSNVNRPIADAVGSISGFTLPSGTTGVVFRVFNNSNTIAVIRIGNTLSSVATATNDHFSDGSVIRASGKYTI
jgi:hypothetical protein